jgi:hypothetical protein
MDVLAVLGQKPGVVLDPEPAEEVHTKSLVFARRRRPAHPSHVSDRPRGGTMYIRP